MYFGLLLNIILAGCMFAIGFGLYVDAGVGYKKRRKKYLKDIENKRFDWYLEKPIFSIDSCVKVCVILGCFFIGLAGICSFFRVEAKRNIYNLEQEQKYIRQVLYEDDDYKNIGLNDKVLEHNREVADVKSTQKHYGFFSCYYGLDTSKLEYILWESE